MAISGVLFLYDVGGMVGWLSGGREGDPEAFLFLLAGVTLCDVRVCHNYK